MNNEPGSKPEDAAKEVIKFTQELIEARDSMLFLKDSHPEMWNYLNNLARLPQPKRVTPPVVAAAVTPAAGAPKAADAAVPAPMPRPNAAAANARRRQGGASDLPSLNPSSMREFGSTDPTQTLRSSILNRALRVI